MDARPRKSTPPPSPADLLASLARQAEKERQLLLVCGPSGSGKTHWCRALAQEAARQGLRIAGLVSPAVFRGGRKVRIDLLDLHSGERHALARRRGEDARGLVLGEWEFQPATLRWGNERLASLPACDLLVVDELGPLEFEQGSGLTAAFGQIDPPACRLVCVAIRPSLLSEAHRRWGWAQVLDLGAAEGA